jgi:hypothetical protein
MIRMFDIMRYIPRKRYVPGWGSETLESVDAVCSDDHVRRVHVTGDAPLWFCLPAKVTVAKKTVTGSLTTDEESTGDPERPFVQVWRFSASEYGKNAALLPPNDFRVR